MRMTAFHIQGFKAIEDATLHWHPVLNILTGSNNSGKTTVLEALALWVECFDHITCQAAKGSKKTGARRGDWYLNWTREHHTAIVSVRSPGFDDLFHKDAKELTLTATIDDGTSPFDIPIRVKRGNGGNYEIAQMSADHTRLTERLNETCHVWPSPFRVFFASPVAAVQLAEEFATPGKVSDMVSRRRSAQVLRNRLHRLASNANRFQRFTDDVGRVLTGQPGSIEISVEGDPQQDVFAKVLARSSRRDRTRDISLLGSGALQIIEVLLSLYLDRADLGLVLLDEPDSHIHRDIQRRLLEVLEDKADGAQVFITTHNESLLRSAKWDQIFHLEPRSSLPVDHGPRHIRPVAGSEIVQRGRKAGLLSSPLRGALASLGAETALDLLNAIESKHFFLVEGHADAALLNTVLEDRIRPAQSTMYWSLGGIDQGLRSLPSLRAVFSEIRNGRSLWEKAVLVLDRDMLTPDQARQVQHNLSEMKLRSVFWNARTTESTLLGCDPDLLPRLVVQAAIETGLIDEGQAVGLGQDDVRSAGERSWKHLQEQLTLRWTTEFNMVDFLGPLNQRLALLGSIPTNKKRNLRSGFPSEARCQEDTRKFHADAIADGRLEQSATKVDVALYVTRVLVGVGVDESAADTWVDSPHWFQNVLGGVKSIRHVPALLQMRDELRPTSTPVGAPLP